MRRYRVTNVAFRPALMNPTIAPGKRLDWADLHARIQGPTGSPAIVEFGVGDAEWIVGQAIAQPTRTFLGVEAVPHFYERAWRMVAALSTPTPNLFLALGDARLAMVPECLPAKSVAELHVLFPDPWPKKRHHRRRMLAETNIPFLATTLVDDGLIHLRSDVPDYVEMALANLLGAGFELVAHEKNTDPARAITRWERKALAEGLAIDDLVFRKPSGLPVVLPTEFPLDPRAIHDHEDSLLRRAGFLV